MLTFHHNTPLGGGDRQTIDSLDSIFILFLILSPQIKTIIKAKLQGRPFSMLEYCIVEYG